MKTQDLQIQITFKNTEHSEVAETYAKEQLQKIVKFLEHEPSPIFMHLIFEPSKVREHSRVEFLLKSPHYDLVSSYEYQGEKFYDVLDRVIDVMYHNLREEKQKRVDERKSVGREGKY